MPISVGKRAVSVTETVSLLDSSVALRCNRVSAGYGDLTIVRDFDLECKRGEIVALIGPNGSGKSTLVKRLAGLLAPSGGTVQVGGIDTTAFDPFELAQLGLRYVPQVRDVFPSLTVRENLIVGITDHEGIERVLAMFPMLRPRLNTMAGKLSGGERKALGIARALMTEKVFALLLDEPSAGLGPAVREALWPVITRISELGVGVLIVEQAVDEVLRVAQSVYVMVAGEQRFAGSAEELRGDVDLGRLFLG